MSVDHISDHFTRHEACCPCCGILNVNHTLVGCLEKLRELCGAPIHINSWCRCAEWNDKVGGVPGSQHVYGRAADVVVRGLEPEEVAHYAEQIAEFRHGGIGIYKTFVHVDVRTSGPARWKG